ncbi:MerR family transcriptional regulator [Paenibacillus sp. E194]|jgi:DNA-binding transcriptional MerR regulator|uniref:MerR family transcriptional regulator n=1 Tax=Paenibacillus alvei TS-15 TaxID=1117108 RepID=S9SRG8_PAEAL|nr:MULTISPECIES: MerR family transcriptional regulator [Paenibacillus]EPY07289.1 MerR family transcriptional regulator [Paenibacillus alvei TS-15]KJB88077.1 MerR family transcriptional regulator [Paenibacillus sp. E194]
MTTDMLTIGLLAARTGITIRTLRYYDKLGLLTPSDYKEGGHRLYNADDLSRLQQIQALKFIGFSLRDIAELLDKPQVEQAHIRSVIAFKKKELLAEQERIQLMMDQLDHMGTIISDHPIIDLRLFCFIVHSILWEEEHLEPHSVQGNSIYNFRKAERVELDRTYFSLITELKQFVANQVNPASYESQSFMKRFMELYEYTLSKIDSSSQAKPDSPAKHANILVPFTEEEQHFLMEAFQVMTRLQ